MSDLPPPPVPADADLRAFAYMPLDIGRLLASSFHAHATDAEWRAGVTLWLKSWHQVPAGSLPTDDVELCRLAEFGRDLRAWKKAKVGALRGWEIHADGLQYHKVVSEKVIEALSRKETISARSRKGNAARWGTRAISTVAEVHPSGSPSGIAGGVLVRPNRIERNRIEGKEEEQTLRCAEVREAGSTDPGAVPTDPPVTPNTPPVPPVPPAAKKSKALVYPPAFEAFWAVYPRKSGKLAALKAWERARGLVSGPDAATVLLDAAKAYSGQTKGKEERFIPHPATWLNQGRWDDQPAPGSVPKFSGGGYVPPGVGG